ncbi:Protein FMP32, mitochondrial [Zancudomyces culisetae]|uniref:Protein FMP32, mitochondrial n=1 Tax=Zancudomyces culisetae TaxID=1213189 RepID=A0A1R1PMW5_ZANCU|nr:Protein FMP32, mitochondrial [Zancudomyces culisetae]|eukprot:OMH82306.1 Protein FMP32, mitochondrial [Zancudomyces culisetae]
MKAENERLSAEIGKLKQLLREEISKSQASVRLDMSLEKGRTRDEQANQEIKIKKADSKIEQEISSLRLQMEAIKFQILQYMFGMCSFIYYSVIVFYIRTSPFLFLNSLFNDIIIPNTCINLLL